MKPLVLGATIIIRGGIGMSLKDCKYRHTPESSNFHPGGTCFRVETMTPSALCVIRRTETAKARNIDPLRWLGSGGSLVGICEPCSMMGCPRRRVEAEYGIMNDGKSGPCPECGKINRREGYGRVACRECGLIYELVEHNEFI
jgi:hypothetical protein